MSSYQCVTCGEYHEWLALCFGPPAPSAYEQIPENERAVRAELTSDICVIDGQHLGIRPSIELEPTDHPLAKEQRDGITWERVLQINAAAGRRCHVKE